MGGWVSEKRIGWSCLLFASGFLKGERFVACREGRRDTSKVSYLFAIHSVYGVLTYPMHVLFPLHAVIEASTELELAHTHTHHEFACTHSFNQS